MRSESEVRERLQELITGELNQRLDLLGKRLPSLCTHNYLHTLDLRKKVGVEATPNPRFNTITEGENSNQHIGLCLLGSDDPETWSGTICEDPVDAKRCPYFSSSHTKASILASLEKDLADEDWLDAHLPEARALMWILGGYDFKISWWKRLLISLKIVKLEPVAPPYELPILP
jgi:hypothetical protein